MLSVSEVYKNAILADSRDVPYKVTMAGAVVYERGNVTNVSFSESVSGNNGIELGTANSATVTFTIREAAPIDYSGMYVKIESGLVLPDGSTEWLPLGEFWVTDFSTSNDYKTLRLTCSDGMYHLTGEYVSSLTYPTDISNVIAEIVTQTGIKFSTLLPKLEIRRKPEGMTYREVIGHLAGCCGKNARFNRLGVLEFVWYTDTNVTIHRETQYMNGFTKLNNKPLSVKFNVTGKEETFNVTVITDDNGGIVATPGRNIVEGETVVLSINPYQDYKLSEISAVTETGKDVQLYFSTNNGRTFIQPDENVTVTASFKKIGSTEHSITVRANGEGTISASKAKAKQGQEVTVDISPNEGYELNSFSVIPSSVSLSKSSETKYTFTMPDGDVTITANFSEIQAEYNISRQIDKGYMTVTDSAGSHITRAKSGNIITVTLMPQVGYELDYFESNVAFTQTDKNVYTFIMPAEDVSIVVHTKFEEDTSKSGTYSWLQKPKAAPTAKPYWAVFYNDSETLPTCQKYYLVWFDSWEAISHSEEKYEIRFNGYYYCGSKNNGHGNHEWNTSTWSGNGASGSTLEWNAYIDRLYADWDDYYGVSEQYCLLASNASLFYKGSVVFQNCEGSISATQTNYVQDGMDVREKGSLTRWHCPDTFSTPAPASNWLILYPNSGLYMTIDDEGKYQTPVSSYPKSLIAFFYDDIQIQNIGAIFSDTDEELYIASFTNARWTYLRDNVLGWDEEIHDLPEGAVVGFRSPLNSTKAADGYLDGNSYNFAGVLVTSQTLYDTSGNTFMYNNACRICDCASAANEVMMFSFKRSVASDDSIVIDSPHLEVTTNGDKIIIRSEVINVTTSGDTLVLALDNIMSDSVTMTYTNPLIYDKMLPTIKSLVQDITYTPAKVKHRGNPALQAGDVIRVPDKDGLLHTIPIMQQTINLGGGMNSEISCPGKTEKTKNFSANSPTQTQIKEAVNKSNLEFERRLAAENSLVYAALNKDISSNAASIELLSQYQTAYSEAFASLEQTVTANSASITSLSQWQSTANISIASLTQKVSENEANISAVVKNGKADAELILSAINGQSTASLKADRILFEGQTLDIKVDAANLLGDFTAKDELGNYLFSVGEHGIHIGTWDIERKTVKQPDGSQLEGSFFSSTANLYKNTKSGQYKYIVDMNILGVYVNGTYTSKDGSVVDISAHKTWLEIVGGMIYE